MKTKTFLASVLLPALIAFVVARYVHIPVVASKEESGLERVLRTNKLRCGYVVWSPYLEVDPNTGKKRGIAYEYVEAIGKELGLDIDWAEEVSWGTFAEGLQSGRYDAMCVPAWEAGSRARRVLYTRPLYNSGVSAVVRASDNRFDEGLDRINQPDVRVAVIDAELSYSIKEQQFPRAQSFSLPQTVDEGLYLLNIATNKADIGFVFAGTIDKFNETAETKLKAAMGGSLVRSFGTSMTVKHGEYGLKFMLDSAISALIRDGSAQRIVARYQYFSVPSPE